LSVCYWDNDDFVNILTQGYPLSFKYAYYSESASANSNALSKWRGMPKKFIGDFGTNDGDGECLIEIDFWNEFAAR